MPQKLSPSNTPPSPRPGSVALRRTVVWAVGAVALGAVYLAYLKPETMVTLANMVWSCF